LFICGLPKELSDIHYQLFVIGCVIRAGDKTGVRPHPYAVRNDVGIRLANRTGLSLHTVNAGDASHERSTFGESTLDAT
jgi:hypothetical protein